MVKYKEKNKKDYLPDIPPQIVEAINERKLVLFVGAGASCQIGLPNWEQLAYNAVEQCCKDGFISFSDKDIIQKSINNSREKLSIVKEFYNSKDRLDDYNKFLKKQFSLNKKNRYKSSIYDFGIAYKSCIVTTNADEIVDEEYEEDLIITEINDSTVSLFQKPYLIKMHGTISKEDTLVFSTSEYLRNYSKPEVEYFLKELFRSDNTILFLGYGLGDFELLEYMLEKTNPDQKHTSHIYILSGYYSYEEAIKESKEKYYRSFGVTQISFCKDEKDFNQIDDVLDKWRKTIDSETSLPQITHQKLKKSIINENISEIIQYVGDDNNLRNYAVNEIKNNNKVDKLLPLLLKTKWTKIKSEKQWIFLDYINDCFDKIKDEESIEIIKEMVINATKKIVSDAKRCKTTRNYLTICDLLVRFDNNIIGANLDKLIKSIEEYDKKFYNHFLLSACGEKSKVDKWDKASLIVLLKYALKNDKNIHNEYEKKKFINHFKDVYASTCPKESFNLALKWIKNKEVDSNYYSMTIGAIALGRNDNKYENKVRYVQRIITTILKKDAKVAKYFLNKNLEKYRNNRLIERLKIYAISCHYKELKEYLFNWEGNPFKQWSLYGDLFYLIDHNNSSITKEETEQMMNWIENSDYENADKKYINVIKYDFIKLLSENHPELIGRAEKYFESDHDRYPSIYDRNKGVRFTRKTIVSSDRLYDKLIKMEIKEAFKWLEDVETVKKYEPDEDLVEATVNKYLEDKNLHNYSIDYIFSAIPQGYYGNVLYSINKTSTNSTVKYDIDLYNKMIDYYEDNNSDDDIIRNIYYKLCNIGYGDLTQEDLIAVCDELQKILKKHNLCGEEQRSSFKQDIIGQIFSSWFCFSLSVLLDCTVQIKDDNYKKKVTEFIKKLAKEQLSPEIRRSAFAWNLDNLLYLDCNWVNDNIDLIIGKQGDIIPALYHNGGSVTLYNYCKNNSVVDTIEQYDLDHLVELKEKLMAISIYRTVIEKRKINDFDIDLIKRWGLKSLKEAFGALNNFLKSNKKTYEARETLKMISEEILKEKSKKEKGVSDAIDEYAKCLLNINGLKSIEWETLTHMSEMIEYGIPIHFSILIKDLLGKAKEKKKIARLIELMVDKYEYNTIYYSTEFMDAIGDMSKDKELKKEFIRINNKLLKKGIYDFVEDNEKAD